MSYCTQADLNRLISDKELETLAVDDPETERLADEAVVQRIAFAIDDAQNEIDDALSAFAETPVATPSEALKALTVRGAVLKLRERKTETFREIDQMRADQHTRDLEAIRSGKRLFGVARTKGLPTVVGNLNPLSSRMYTPGGTDDPAVANAGKTDPLRNY